MGSRTILVTLTLLALGAVAAGNGAAPAAPPAEPANLQATLEDSLRESGAPGVSAAVVDDGRLVWSGVAGTRTPGGAAVEPATRFVTASAGKSVTAGLVLRLADEGRLALGDRVSEYVKGLPGARRIRIRNLLEHSSGLADYFADPSIWRTIQRDPAHAWTRDELLDAVRDRRLRFRPGSRVAYSNTNYIALGGVIEAVTGVSVEDEFHRSLAGSLGLLDSSWRYDPALFETGARPYLETRGGGLAPGWDHGFVSTDYVGEVWTDGGFATTGADLARFANALVAGDLLSASGRRALLRFRERGYGRGVFRDRFAGRRIIGHDGLYAGFTAQHWTDPASGITIAVLTNRQSRGGDPSWEVWRRLAREAL